MEIPDEAAWRSEPWGIDVPYAYKHFFGKTIAEATRLFDENALRYQEDIMFMPSAVFPYYVRAYIAWVLSVKSQNSSDGASCFIGLIDFKAERKPQDLAPMWQEIEPALEKLATQQDYFGAEWSTYGDFRARIHRIVERGFGVSFETAIPEHVPDWAALARLPSHHYLSMSAALQILRNSGIDGVTPTSSRDDVVRILGEPSAAGGGKQRVLGWVPQWIRYDRQGGSVHFTFTENGISHISFP